MSKKLKVFRLSLKSWLRGEGDADSKLYRPRTDTYCCLGQFAIQCGLSKTRIQLVPSPDDIGGDLPADVRALLTADELNTAATKDAMAINDDRTTTDAQKVAALRPIFRKWGYRIEVVE